MFNKFVGEYVTGLDVEIGYNVYEYDRVSLNTPYRTTGSQFRLRGSYDINEKWSVSGGVGVESGGYLQALNGSNVFVGGDVIVDYNITQDRRMKLRFSNIYDQVLEGRRNKTAAGIRFRQEFDSLQELIDSWKRQRKVEKTEKGTSGEGL